MALGAVKLRCCEAKCLDAVNLEVRGCAKRWERKKERERKRQNRTNPFESPRLVKGHATYTA